MKLWDRLKAHTGLLQVVRPQTIPLMSACLLSPQASTLFESGLQLKLDVAINFKEGPVTFLNTGLPVQKCFIAWSLGPLCLSFSVARA